MSYMKRLVDKILDTGEYRVEVPHALYGSVQIYMKAELDKHSSLCFQTFGWEGPVKDDDIPDLEVTAEEMILEFEVTRGSYDTHFRSKVVPLMRPKVRNKP